MNEPLPDQDHEFSLRDDLRRPAVRQNIIATVVAALILIVVGWLVDVPKHIASFLDNGYEISVQYDPDLIEIAGDPVAGAYLVDLPIQDVPDPPLPLNTCEGRYNWAQSLDAVLADTSNQRMTIFAKRDHLVRLLHLDVDVLHRFDPPEATHLNCPGRGDGNEVFETSVLDLNLDADPATSDLFDANGAPQSTQLQATQESPITIDISARSFTCFCAWELDVVLEVDGQLHRGTVRAADGGPFITASAMNSPSYQFIDGEWVQVADPGEPTPGDVPQPADDILIPPQPCQLIGAPDMAEALSAEDGVNSQTGLPSFTPGASGLEMVDLRCLWTSQDPPINSSADEGVLDGADLSLSAFRSPEDAQTEFDVRRGNYSGPVSVEVPGAVAAFAVREDPSGTVVALVDSTVVTINLTTEPSMANDRALALISSVVAAL